MKIKHILDIGLKHAPYQKLLTASLLLSTSSPQIIKTLLGDDSNFGLNDEKYNRDYVTANLPHAKHVVVDRSDLYLLDTSKPNLKVAFVVKNEMIVFYFYYAVRTFNGFSVVQELIVWQNPFKIGLARKILLWFLTKYDIIRTDRIQYGHRHKMWEKLVQANYDKLHCYTVKNKQLQRITNMEQLAAIWGVTRRYRRLAIYISTKEIQ